MGLPKLVLSVVALTAVNCVPLAGILVLDWDATVIVLLYWTENVIIGAYNIVKIAMVKVDRPILHLTKLFAIPFFSIHFGGFCAVHGLFLLFFFGLGDGLESFSPGPTWPGPFIFVQLLVAVLAQLWRSRPYGMEWPVIGLVLSHGVSFVQNYLVGKEYLSLSIGELMSQPYKRIVLLHVAIIAGAIPIVLLGSPIPLLLILVVAKIWIDIRLHIKSHKLGSAGGGGGRKEGGPEPAAEPDSRRREVRSGSG